MASRKYERYETASLDAVIENMLNSMQEPTPAFIKDCEKNVSGELKDYTKDIISRQLCENIDIMSIIENYADKLLDSISESNRVYFKTGIKTGAIFLLQLLDF